MTPLDAMKQALEALEYYDDKVHLHMRHKSHLPALTNLRTAIAEMEAAEPVAWALPFVAPDYRGWIPCRFEREGDFNTPLYLHPAALTEPAPQEVRPELTTSEVGNVTNPNPPAGATHELSNNIGQLPDEVAEMVKFLNSHGVGNDVNWRSARLAADMLERLARENEQLRKERGNV